MTETIIECISAIFCVILGWKLNCLYENKLRKVRLNYSLQQAADISDDDKSLRTKYSESDYCLQIYNTGNTPYILQQISLQNRKHIITDCIIIEEKTLQPYEKFIYRFSEQEYDAILWHCEKEDIKRCKVIAFDIESKKNIGNLDLTLPYLQSHPRKIVY